MVTMKPIETYKRFRFDVDGAEGKLGLTFVRHTPAGLEIGRAHCVGRPTLLAELNETACSVLRVTLHERDRLGVRREVIYRLGSMYRHLAIDLDALENHVAWDRVLFPEAELLSCRDYADTGE